MLKNPFKYYKEGLLALLSVAFISGCVSTNPATGKQHLSLVSEEQEYEIGHETYAAVIKQGGGLYKENYKLNTYLKERLLEIVQVSERADKPFKLTILDDHNFNAAALPGYIFINRGILPFLHNEAQLVSILSHEVGHVTARHTARQATTRTVANIGMTLLDAYIAYNTQGNPALREVQKVTDVATPLLFASYSRGHEEEADSLAIRYLNKLKYDPYAVSASFSALAIYSKHQKNLYKKAGEEIQDSLFHRLISTHPESHKRAQTTMEEAANKGKRSYLVHRDRYLGAIEGTTFGPKIKEHGVAKRDVFVHPKHRFSFMIPEGYIAPMDKNLPTAFHPTKKRVMFYNVKAVPEDEDAEESLIYTYKKVRDIQPIQLGDITGYTGIMIGKDKKTKKKVISRIVGFKGNHPLESGEKAGKTGFYSLHFMSNEENFQTADKEFMKIAKSIRLLTKKEAEKVEPLRIRIYTTKKGDTQKSIAEKMAFSADRLYWLRLINDLSPSDKILPDMRLKMIY